MDHRGPVHDSPQIAKEQVDLVKRRFVHRSDRFVKQWWNHEKGDGGYVPITDGVCTETPKCERRTCPHMRRVPINDAHLARHLEGRWTVGVYQLAEDATVAWLCLDVDIDKHADLDDGEAMRRAQLTTTALARTLQRERIPFLVEFSGSRGYHVWVFFAEPIEAAKAQALGKYLAWLVEWAEGINIEVYPKQNGGRAYGNLVKLPMGVHQKTDLRSFFCNRRFDPLDDPWGALASVGLLTKDDVERIIDEHEIEVVEHKAIATDDRPKGALPCFVNIMTQGTMDGRRDAVTFKLACYLRDRGLPYEMAFAAMDDWNGRNQRPYDHAYLKAKVESAYTRAYPPYPCNDPLFDVYCEEGCVFYAKKMRSRGSTVSASRRDAM